MLESRLHGDNAFVTLTYSDDKLPMSPLSQLPELRPKDLQDWLKRLRKAIAPSLVRYYAVGEYGDATFRPHYHAVLFGLASCRQTQTQYRNGFLRCCSQCELVRDTWGQGNVYLGTLETSSAQYVCGYVTKKMTRHDDPRLQGRHAEFARMSLKPGIGYDAMHEVASTMMQFNLETRSADVPSALQHGKRKMPLGRYLRASLRTMVGKEKEAPDETLQEIEKALQPMREAAKRSEENPSFSKQIVEAHHQKRLNQTSRLKIRKQRKTL